MYGRAFICLVYCIVVFALGIILYVNILRNIAVDSDTGPSNNGPATRNEAERTCN